MLYLSEQWISAANQAVAGLPPLSTPLVAGYDVSGATPYSVRLGPDAVSVLAGIEDADVTFICGWDLACAISQGQRSAQRAFLDGELKIAGDVNRLLGNADAFAALQDCLSSLRAETTYSD